MQRIDRFLWFARFFKSRTLAAGAVADGRVRINGVRSEKPSTPVKFGDVLTFPAGGQIRVVKVVNGGERRGPASEARMLYEEMTPPRKPAASEDMAATSREKGSGRPTKKERRAISAFTRDGAKDE